MWQIVRLGIVKAVHRLDKADGADGNQIVLILGVGIIFFNNVGHQPEVMFNELVSRIHIAVVKPL